MFWEKALDNLLKAVIFVAWFVPVPLVYLAENAIRKRRGKSEIRFTSSFAMVLCMASFFGATTTPWVAPAFLLFFLIVFLLTKFWGGIGQRFESKSYTGYFRAVVKSAKTGGAEVAAVVRITRENGMYFAQDVFLPVNGSHIQHHIGMMSEDTQVFPLSKSRVYEGFMGNGEVWDIQVVNKKGIHEFEQNLKTHILYPDS